jgi:hypothetical protein
VLLEDRHLTDVVGMCPQPLSEFRSCHVAWAGSSSPIGRARLRESSLILWVHAADLDEMAKCRSRGVYGALV